MYKTLQELFVALLEIDSPSGEEKEVSDFVMAYLQNLGLNPVQDKHNMVYCRIGSGEEPVIFCNHLDTVEPGRNIQVVIEDGVIRSAGETILGADNKAGLATILWNVANLVDTETELNIELLFSVDEETRSGVTDFDISLLESKKAVVIDGGSDIARIVTQSSSIGQFEIELIGTASHTSTPELANNALEAFMYLSRDIKLGMIADDTTLNIGLLSSGSAANTIPGSLQLEGDLRSADVKIYQSQKNKLLQAFNSLSLSHNIEVKIMWSDYADAYTIDPESDNLDKLRQIYQSVGLEPNLATVTSGSDAGFLNKIGIEAFCLGDGVDDPHTVDESITVSALNKLSEITHGLIVNF
ncbi:M20/M25/M40 family metallo-hydrolase [Candidatus Saccharibacteria bacterium]|jgi:tripeptide aminopeptidase|nr:M20/M25/M40 family metallo-hydrolase [Candidatus Saccharibacteria bacterium]MBP9132144.1 M20/M25/M40 family metallo-hydrolase [Candidatus Saccharibacteria bacterium]